MDAGAVDYEDRGSAMIVSRQADRCIDDYIRYMSAVDDMIGRYLLRSMQAQSTLRIEDLP